MSTRPRHLRAVSPDDDAPGASRAPIARRVLRRTLARERERRGSLLGWLMLMGLAAVAAVVVGPHLVDVELPTDAAAIGTPARGRVVADRDYEVVDEAATRARRTAARDAVLPRFAFDASTTTARIDALFAVLDEATAPGGETRRHELAALLSARGLSVPSAPVLEGLVELAVDEALRERVRVELSREGSGFTLSDDDALAIGATDALSVRGVVHIGDEHGKARTLDDVRALRSVDSVRAALARTLSPWLAEGGDRVRADALARHLASLVEATLTRDPVATEAARVRAERETPAIVHRARRGETLLVAGQLIDERHHALLAAMSVRQGDAMRARAMLATFAFVLLASFVVYRFGFGRVLGQRARIRDLSFLSLLVLSLLIALVVVDGLLLPLHEKTPAIPRAAFVFAIPATWAAMQARLVLHSEGAFAVALLTALFAGAVTEPGLGMTVVTLLASLVGIASVGRLRSRAALLVGGLLAGGTGAVALVTWELFRGTLEGRALAFVAAALVVNGVLSGVLVIGLSPLLEGVFGYVSDLKLLSLDDMNHPLLKQLIVRAPGTWHHAMRVAVLAEGAAEATHANALLARVIGLYHDVGKLTSPEDFVENRRRDRSHDDDDVARLARIRAHVERGRVLATEHRLPRSVVAALEEHHADVDIIDRSAVPVAKSEEGDGRLDVRRLRSEGRRPRTRESALVMLADRVEWATRDLVDESAVQRAVDATVAEVLLEGALDESDLSLRDLDVAREAFVAAILDMSPARRDDGHALAGEGA